MWHPTCVPGESCLHFQTCPGMEKIGSWQVSRCLVRWPAVPGRGLLRWYVGFWAFRRLHVNYSRDARSAGSAPRYCLAVPSINTVVRCRMSISQARCQPPGASISPTQGPGGQTGLDPWFQVNWPLCPTGAWSKIQLVLPTRNRPSWISSWPFSGISNWSRLVSRYQ